MRIRIMAEGKSIWMDIPDSKGNFIFGELAAQLIQFGESMDFDKDKCIEVPEEKMDVPVEMLHKTKVGFKGFLYIKCKECGKETSFFSKDCINDFHCRDCGTYTNLYKLARVNVSCKCGTNYYYHTNMEDSRFDVTCIECRESVTVAYNDKAEAYEPTT